MCTDTCPCYSKKITGKEPYYNFKNNIPETRFNEYWRTKFTGKEKRNVSYIPLVWEHKDPSKGYNSFKECYDDWIDKAEKDKSIDLYSTFSLDKKKLLKPG